MFVEFVKRNIFLFLLPRVKMASEHVSSFNGASESLVDTFRMRMSSAASVKSVCIACFTPATYIRYRQSCREICSLAALRRAVASQPFDLQSEMPIPVGGVTPATSAYVSIRQHTADRHRTESTYTRHSD